MNRILIATDGSDGGWAAVQEGVELACEVGAKVTFVTVRHNVSLLGDPWHQRLRAGAEYCVKDEANRY